jgi:hypothetical protein
MRGITQIVGEAVAVMWLACLPCGAIGAEFVGSTPGGALPREFLGGLPADAPCHCVMWQLTLRTNRPTYDVVARYRIPSRGNTNQSADGPSVTSRGRWEVVKGARPNGVVYRLTSEKTQRSLFFVTVGENLLHLLNPDGTLMVGNGGWSYTLNRADHAEKPGDPSQAPDMSYKISPLATGPNVFGVFEGRSPCLGIARELKIPQHTGMKVKWRVTLYQNPETSTPTTYRIEGSLHRQAAREGTWSIVRGTKTDPNATIYQLSPTATEAALVLLKGDDNVLFFVNGEREPLIGHADFSYTLNRRSD